MRGRDVIIEAQEYAIKEALKALKDYVPRLERAEGSNLCYGHSVIRLLEAFVAISGDEDEGQDHVGRP